MKIGIGTVQFGMDYGISNSQGKTSIEEVEKILNVAALNGIRVIDTAAMYGTSEEVLGLTLPAKHSFDIVTKTPKFEAQSLSDGAQLLEDTFHRSLERMRLNSVYGLLIHHADDLLVEGGHVLMERMLGLKQRGLVKKIGVSVYKSNQIDIITDRFSIDIIQLPINVLDQRLLASGHLPKLKSIGVEIHARSIFLQGLLLMDSDVIPSYFNQIKKHLIRYKMFLENKQMSPLQGALKFAFQIPELDTIILGINTYIQFSHIMNAIEGMPDGYIEFSGWSIKDEQFVNPALWKISNH